MIPDAFAVPPPAPPAGAGIRFDYDAEKGALSWETPPGLPLALEWLLRF